MEAAGRDDLLTEIINNAGRFFSKDLRPRRGDVAAHAQRSCSTVIRRLRLVMTEVRGDWLPETLQHLDDAYEQVRDDRPRPAQAERVLAGALPDGLVVRAQGRGGHAPRDRRSTRIVFGRDYPHAEGTWPNTARLAERRVRGRARRRVATHARRERHPGARVGSGASSPRSRSGSARPSTDVTGRTPELDPRLLANWDARGGYLKPAEQHDPDAIDALLRDDLELVGSRS